MRTLFRSVVAVSSALVILCSAPSVALASPVPDAARPSAKQQQVYWKWSDESQKTSRLFREARYQRASKLPRLVVTAVPAKPARVVYLQFRQKGKWLVETKTSTNAKGVAIMRLDPYCSNRTWCDGTWTYRIKVGTLYQTLKVTYRGQ